MIPFDSKFPELAETETRVLHVFQDPELPPDEYGFREWYCADLSCDCQRVMIIVHSVKTIPKTWATITYGWESVEFYAKWVPDQETAEYSAGVRLEVLGEQSQYAERLLRAFKDLLTDKAYANRLKRHYHLMKRKAAEEMLAELPLKPLGNYRSRLPRLEKLSGLTPNSKGKI